MKTTSLLFCISLFSLISITACSSDTRKSPYVNSPEEQKASAKRAQQELSREVSK